MKCRSVNFNYSKKKKKEIIVPYPSNMEVMEAKKAHAKAYLFLLGFLGVDR